ncbi:MAG: class I SAM-dependent methyltransferase [Planctomycetes bacterium]|nr:class I SAM-dependent methyltransferase [Planctomycetota bacterium]
MSGVRAFVLGGVDAAAALDWLHVHGDVDGVIEGDSTFTVYSRASLPKLPFASVSVREIVVSADSIEATGLENDAPILVAADLLVRPPWVARPPDFVGVELVVPRGNAFGSGEHASTKAALRCLHRAWNSPASVADVGTGSGILALYAAVRGCRRVEACDIEEPAVAAARELLPSARVRLGAADTMGACDCVVANMTGTELTASMPAILRCWTRRDALVLSGMRAHEVAAVVAMVDAPIVDRETVEAFTAVVFRGKAT